MNQDQKRKNISIGPLALENTGKAVNPPSPQNQTPQPLKQESAHTPNPVETEDGENLHNKTNSPEPDIFSKDAPFSICQKLDPERLAELNRAIVNRRTGSLRDLHRTFCLDQDGVSFSSFYRHARRLRLRVSAFEAASLALPAEADISGQLPQLVAQQMLESLTLGEPTANDIYRMAGAYRSLVRTHALVRETARKERTTKNDPELEKIRKQLQAGVQQLAADTRKRWAAAGVDLPDLDEPAPDQG